MGIIQLIALLCFYIIKLTGCNTIGKLNHNDPDCISNQTEAGELSDNLTESFNKLNATIQALGKQEVLYKLIDELSQPNEMLNNSGNNEMEGKASDPAIAYKEWCNAEDNISQPGNHTNQMTIEQGSELTGFSKEHNHTKLDWYRNRKPTNNKIDLSKALTILKKIKADPAQGAVNIANKFFTKHGKEIITSSAIGRFLKKNDLNNEKKRYKAKKNGELEKMIKEIEKALKKAKNQTIAQASQSTAAEPALTI